MTSRAVCVGAVAADAGDAGEDAGRDAATIQQQFTRSVAHYALVHD